MCYRTGKYSLKARPCIFQLRKFTGGGREGVKLVTVQTKKMTIINNWLLTQPGLPMPGNSRHLLFYGTGTYATGLVHNGTGTSFSVYNPLSTSFYTVPHISETTLRASLSGTFLQTLPDLVTPLKGHSLSPRSCPQTRSAPSERFGY